MAVVGSPIGENVVKVPRRRRVREHQSGRAPVRL
jgi:hypothetical protein